MYIPSGVHETQRPHQPFWTNAAIGSMQVPKDAGLLVPRFTWATSVVPMGLQGQVEIGGPGSAGTEPGSEHAKHVP